jgi:hypothetical protein
VSEQLLYRTYAVVRLRSEFELDWNVGGNRTFRSLCSFFFDRYHQVSKNNMLIHDKGQEAVCGHAAAVIGKWHLLSDSVMNNTCEQHETFHRTSRHPTIHFNTNDFHPVKPACIYNSLPPTHPPSALRGQILRNENIDAPRLRPK